MEQTELPPVWDCYALNVDGEDAWLSAYGAFHLINVVGDDVGSTWYRTDLDALWP